MKTKVLANTQSAAKADGNVISFDLMEALEEKSRDPHSHDDSSCEHHGAANMAKKQPIEKLDLENFVATDLLID